MAITVLVLLASGLAWPAGGRWAAWRRRSSRAHGLAWHGGRDRLVSGPVVGIDLGTTNSSWPRSDDDGQVVVLPNAVGGEITPSVVYFEPDGGVVVGEEALQATAVDPDNGVQLIKRSMGTEFPLSIRGQDHTPESISALILRQLAAAACGDAGGPVRAVITVPAYFGLAEREATYQAGVIAGLEVLELLDEPVAAAAHYGLTSGADRTVLVYDLGGGTFDTTVLRITGGAGDGTGHRRPSFARRRRRRPAHPRPGARRLEDVLSAGRARCDRRRTSGWLGELVLDVEAAKKRPQRADVAGRSWSAPPPGGSVTVTRADLDAVCGDLFDTTAEIIERVLAAAGSAGPGRRRRDHGRRIEPDPGAGRSS